MNTQTETLTVPGHIEPVLERVLAGRAPLEVATKALEINEYELGILLRALIRQRAAEQSWEVA